MASDADDPAPSHRGACLGIGGVLLSDMDAVATGGEREVGTIVHQERHAALLRHRAQRVGGAADRVVIGRLEAKLDAGDVAGIERCRKAVGEGRRFEGGRRDEVEAGAAQLSPL